MKCSEFVKICKDIASSPTVYYSVSGGDWCKWNGKSWNMDCICMIKGILWGFNFNKNHPHGGAIYNSNGVYDDTTEGIMKRCTKISKDFKNIKIGEILHMNGHVGVYIGNRQVVETTADWDYCTQITTVDEDGRRHKGSSYGRSWEEHGELSYIEYDELKHKLNEKVRINKVYVSSESVNPLTPAIKEGTITKIIDSARNPYLLDNGNIGWVNDECIIDEEPLNYEKLYKDEVEKNKILQEKINNAIKDLS